MYIYIYIYIYVCVCVCVCVSKELLLVTWNYYTQAEIFSMNQIDLYTIIRIR